ncbi:hypothetical protein GGX14DRAFT_404237 [Mycena pura]|uniref:Uncharacterized protein n=1 Tax=Mycena pura TaxID=153505 RepID=A0AAD6Y1T9_9AGAR|nr:hypothetical protein GGX14DRAFT_404237 [Mycena pura]
MERCRKELLLRYTFELDSAQQQGMCITNKYFRKWAVMAGKCWLECEHWGRRATVATAAGARGCMLCMGRVVSGVVTSARCHSGVGGRQPPAYQKGVVRYPFGKRAVVGILGSGWTTARTARTVGGGQRAAKTVTAAMGGGAAGRGTHAVGRDGQAVGHGAGRRACNTTGSGAATNKAKPNKNIVCINERMLAVAINDSKEGGGNGGGHGGNERVGDDVAGIKARWRGARAAAINV